ncbi:reverse transcriptase domain-containing protein [Tanacetum coccineum]
MTPIHEYLVSGLLPEDLKESRKIRVKAPQYKLIRGSLYRRSFYTPWLRYVASPQTDNIVKEIHEGSCSFNAEPQLMVLRITKQGYYWPSIRRTLHEMGRSKTYEHYKRKACREIRMGTRSVQIRSAMNNQLEGQKAFLRRAHGNNEPYKKQLARSQQGWVDDLTQILWVHRTLPINSQKETPFSLTYGSKAIIPISKNNVAKDDRGGIKEVEKRSKSKEYKPS